MLPVLAKPAKGANLSLVPSSWPKSIVTGAQERTTEPEPGRPTDEQKMFRFAACTG